MTSHIAAEFIIEIDDNIKRIRKFSKSSDLLDSYLAKYLVVFICGIYEEAIESIINNWIKLQKPSMEIIRFIDLNLHQKFQNPCIDRLIEILSEFNEEWVNTIKMAPDESKTALNNIVLHKNCIAHGHSSDITLGEVINFHKKAQLIIGLLDDILH